MSQVVLRATIGASADEVWATISDFNGAPNYLGGLATSTMEGEGVGAVRTVTTKDGTQVQERLERFDPATYLLSYTIIAGPLPMANYVATMQLQSASGILATLYRAMPCCEPLRWREKWLWISYAQSAPMCGEYSPNLRH